MLAEFVLAVVTQNKKPANTNSSPAEISRGRHPNHFGYVVWPNNNTNNNHNHNHNNNTNVFRFKIAKINERPKITKVWERRAEPNINMLEGLIQERPMNLAV